MRRFLSAAAALALLAAPFIGSASAGQSLYNYSGQTVIGHSLAIHGGTSNVFGLANQTNNITALKSGGYGSQTLVNVSPQKVLGSSVATGPDSNSSVAGIANQGNNITAIKQ